MNIEEKRHVIIHQLLVLVVLLFAGCQIAPPGSDWDRDFTDEEWLEMVKQPQHQPVTVWRGIGVGNIHKSKFGHTYDGLTFHETPARVLEHHLSTGLLQRRPLLFLRLFNSSDPCVVLNGMYIYRGAMQTGMKAEHKQQIETAFRRLLDHKDVRIRFTAIRKLAKGGRLTVNDVEKGLTDKALCVRVVTAWWLEKVASERSQYDMAGKLVKGDPAQIEKLVETKRKLAPVLLEHLNDTFFLIRAEVSNHFRDLFKQKVTSGRGIEYELPPTFPNKFDWVRSDWNSRDKIQREWQAWWAEHGEEALRWAHPAQ